MRKILPTVMLVFVLGFCSTLALASPKIAVVDIQRVIDESVAGKAAKNDLQSAGRKVRARLSLLEKELNQEREALRTQAALLSKDALSERTEELARRERDFQRKVKDERAKLARTRDQRLKKIVDVIDQLISEVAVERGVDFVFENDRTEVLYAAPALDMSLDVLKKLDSKALDL